ncbi:hypothetical protein EXIGLDRAFT_729788, partial [Exidia glandulosa HHB12029]
MLDKYIVTLRGESFTLYRDQIEFDAPNYFSDLFLGDFSESQTRTVELSRSPELFRAIVDYMSGYSILPLTAAVVPSTMTPDIAHKNLLHDAGFYGLQGLVKLLSSAPTPPRFSAACDAFLLGQQAVNFEDVLRGKLPSGVTFDERGVGTMVGEKWLAAPIIALNALLVVDYVYRPGSPSLVFGLISPSSQPFLARTFANSLPLPRLFFIDSLNQDALPCSVSGPAHIIVRGVEASGREFTLRMAALRASPQRGETHPIDVHLREIFSQETRYIFVGEKIIFSITGGTAENPRRVSVVAAELTSRHSAARNFL